MDADGRCVGILSAADIVHWVKEGAQGAEDVPADCPFQTSGRLLGNGEGVICTLGQGACSFQEIQPSLGGRHVAVCLLPKGHPRHWQNATKNLPVSVLQHYMTVELVTVSERVPLLELARIMTEAHIHRVVVTDKQQRPVGIVSCTDLVAALAHGDDRPGLQELFEAHRHCRGAGFGDNPARGQSLRGSPAGTIETAEGGR